MDKQKTNLQLSATPLLKLIKRLLLITFWSKIVGWNIYLLCSSAFHLKPFEQIYNVVKFLFYVIVCSSNPHFEQLGPKTDPQPNFSKRLTEKLSLFTKTGFNFFYCSKKLCVHLFRQKNTKNCKKHRISSFFASIRSIQRQQQTYKQTGKVLGSRDLEI